MERYLLELRRSEIELSAGEKKWPRSDRKRHCCLYKRFRLFLHPPSIYTMKFVRRFTVLMVMSVPSFHGFTNHTREYIRLLFECIQGSFEYERRLAQDEIRLEV